MRRHYAHRRTSSTDFLITSRLLLSVSGNSVRPYEQSQGRGTMTKQERRFAAVTAKRVNEACAGVRASLRWAAALSVSAVASFGAATWLLFVNSHLPFSELAATAVEPL
jgi:hypothetical protein